MEPQNGAKSPSLRLKNFTFFFQRVFSERGEKSKSELAIKCDISRVNKGQNSEHIFGNVMRKLFLNKKMSFQSPSRKKHFFRV